MNESGSLLRFLLLLSLLTRCEQKKGTMTFVTPDGEVTASAGDLMTVPPGAIHTFKNASETEDCECYMTATPGECCILPPRNGGRLVCSLILWSSGCRTLRRL
jgi:hypothetical protein